MNALLTIVIGATLGIVTLKAIQRHYYNAKYRRAMKTLENFELDLSFVEDTVKAAMPGLKFESNDDNAQR